ncbi:hypothetical protein BDR05DRAFT_951957 [Suillus weaverae]|nr:hypothetical protein BDR05DRAFT_951957 [Suillus weaverae]
MSSPKRLKAQCKVADDIPALTGQGKKAWAVDSIGLVSLQLTLDLNAPAICRSGCPGAGTGGRNAQLKKHHIDRAMAAAQSISDITGSIIKCSCQKGKKGKDITHEPSHASLQPGRHFRFQTPQGNTLIMPPGTEPDLQALNNPYIAMTKKNAQNHNHNAVQSLPGGHQSSFNGLANGDLQHSVLPSAPLSHHLSAAHILPYRQLWWEQCGCDDAGEREFGWAKVGKHHLAHPGFSWEPEPSPVHVTSILALTSTFNTPMMKLT